MENRQNWNASDAGKSTEQSIRAPTARVDSATEKTKKSPNSAGFRGINHRNSGHPREIFRETARKPAPNFARVIQKNRPHPVYY